MTTITELINKIITGIINPLIVLLFGIALVTFLWGVIQYVIGSQGDEKTLDKGKQVMFWGIVGMFIMISALGIVKMLCGFFGTCSILNTPMPP